MINDIASIVIDRLNMIDNIITEVYHSGYTDCIYVKIYGISKICFYSDHIAIYINNNNHISHFDCDIDYSDFTDVDELIGAILSKRFYD